MSQLSLTPRSFADYAAHHAGKSQTPAGEFIEDTRFLLLLNPPTSRSQQLATIDDRADLRLTVQRFGACNAALATIPTVWRNYLAWRNCREAFPA